MRLGTLIGIGLAAALCLGAPAGAQTIAIGDANRLKCPEDIPDPEARIWALASWMRDITDRDPRAKEKAVLERYRRAFLIEHRCVKTLRAMGAGG